MFITLDVNRLLASLSVLAVTTVYYVFYFIGFSETQSDGGALLLILKLVSVAAFSVFSLNLKSLLSPKSSALYLFYVIVWFGLVVLTVKSIVYGFEDLKYFNVIISSLPFLLFNLKNSLSFYADFFKVLVIVLMIQIAIDFYVLLTGLSLWENKAFVGGVGNANSFGFICNIGISYLLYCKRLNAKCIACISLLSLGVLLTSSLMSVLFMMLNYLVYSLKRNLLFTIFICTLFVLSVVLFYEYFISEHLKFKIESLISLLSGEGGTQSRSVSLRVHIYSVFYDSLVNHTLHLLLFGYHNYSYYIADSQFLTYFGSFGLLWSFVFFAFLFATLIRARFILKNEFYTMVMLQFITYFIVNRILDYYPVPLILVLMVSLIWRFDDGFDRLQSAFYKT